MPARPPDRRLPLIAYQARALFGAGFVVLGVIALYRVAFAAAPAGSRLFGCAIGVAMIALGGYRVAQYVRWKREDRSGP